MTEVLVGPDDQVPHRESRGAPLLWVLLVAIVLSLGLNIVLAVMLMRERDQQSARELCDSLELPSSDGADAADVTVFFALDRDEDDAAEVADELEGRDEVESVEVWDRQQAYEEFQMLFADSPEILDATTPDLLPVQVRIEVVDDDQRAMDALADEMGAVDGVGETVVAPGTMTLERACVAA